MLRQIFNDYKLIFFQQKLQLFSNKYFFLKSFDFLLLLRGLALSSSMYPGGTDKYIIPIFKIH